MTIQFSSGICGADGLDTGNGQKCNPVVTKWLQAIITQAAQSGMMTLDVDQVQRIALMICGDPVVAALAAKDYKTWCALAAAQGASNFIENSPAVVIPVALPDPKSTPAPPAQGSPVNASPDPQDFGFFAKFTGTGK